MTLVREVSNKNWSQSVVDWKVNEKEPEDSVFKELCDPFGFKEEERNWNQGGFCQDGRDRTF